MKALLQHVLMVSVDTLYRLIPQPRPSASALQRARLVSHRGEHDNERVVENTLPAFRAARSAGVWGLETDIRWSRDLVPLVVHDADGARLFGDPGRFAELEFAEIRARMPLVPSLREFLGEFGHHMHLMLEIKDEYYPEPERQKSILKEHLAGLRPGADFHVLALDPDLFERVDFLDRSVMFPVAELNVGRLSAAAIDQGLGGLTGHFLLLSDRLKARHEAQGQKIGTGFPNSRNCLFRELNRNVEWVFSNDAARLQRLIDELL